VLALVHPVAEPYYYAPAQFLELGQAHVTAETLVQMKDLLRRRPQVSELDSLAPGPTSSFWAALPRTHEPATV